MTFAELLTKKIKSIVEAYTKLSIIERIFQFNQVV